MKLFFLHMPKSAGTSFTELLQKTVYRDNFKVVDVVHTGNTSNVKTLHKDFISGHVDFLDMVKFKDTYKYVTILRDPVERCISWYKFNKLFYFRETCDLTRDNTLEVISNNRNHPAIITHCHNMMTYMLGDHANANRRTLSPEECLKNAKENIAKFDDVLFLNTFIEDFKTFISKYKFDCDISKLRRLNTTDSIDVNITQEAITNFKKCNELDIELFDYARKLFKGS
jgi:hypothetical protein